MVALLYWWLHLIGYAGWILVLIYVDGSCVVGFVAWDLGCLLVVRYCMILFLGYCDLRGFRVRCFTMLGGLFMLYFVVCCGLFACGGLLVCW